MPEEKEFLAYFSCREDENGSIKAFHICSDVEISKKWIADGIESSDDPNKEKATKQSHEEFSTSSAEEGFPALIDHIINSLKSFYDLVTINSTINHVFPYMYINNEINDIRKTFEIVEDSNQHKIYGVHEDRISTLNSRIKKLNHIRDGISSMPANILMGLVARFDANIGRLARFLLTNRKEKLASGGRTILIKDVLSAPSFDDLITDLVDDEVHLLMKGNHDEQVKYFEESFSIKIRDGFDLWPNFIEVFERRNLAAHGEGVVNSRYDKICSKANVPTDCRLKLGEPVRFDDKYCDIQRIFYLNLEYYLFGGYGLKSNQPRRRMLIEKLTTQHTI